MVNKRILILSNYPIKEPLHGGQKRVAAIVNEYKKIFSDVKSVAIFLREHYPAYSKDDIYITGDLAEELKGDYLTSDLGIAKAMLEDPDVKSKIQRVLLSFSPHIIQIEQVFLFIGLKKILDELNLNIKIVYSAHNIEAPMRQEIMEIGKASKEEIDQAVSLIQQTEQYLAKKADLVIAVSEEVRKYLIDSGAQKVVLAINGVYPLNPSEESLDYWKSYFQDRLIKKVVTFIGSGHLPNRSGFKKMVGFRVGFMPSDSKIILAGEVGNNIEEEFDPDDILNIPFWKRVINVGVLDDDKLNGLILSSEVILLPIVEGSGSNLKTAEAILSRRKIVGTNFSFRGFEEFKKLSNVWLADSPEEFRKAISKAFQVEFKQYDEKEIELANKVQWKSTLSEALKKVKEL